MEQKGKGREGKEKIERKEKEKSKKKEKSHLASGNKYLPLSSLFFFMA